MPRYIILFYILKGQSLIQEHIKIEKSGYLFHDCTFVNLDQLILWFKEARNKEDYQHYLVTHKNPISNIIDLEAEPDLEQPDNSNKFNIGYGIQDLKQAKHRSYKNFDDDEMQIVSPTEMEKAIFTAKKESVKYCKYSV